MLGQPNKGFYYLMQELPQERLIIADFAQAACEWMFEETRSYVKQRKAFGKTISNLQVKFAWCDRFYSLPMCNSFCRLKEIDTPFWGCNC